MSSLGILLQSIVAETRQVVTSLESSILIPSVCVILAVAAIAGIAVTSKKYK